MSPMTSLLSPPTLPPDTVPYLILGYVIIGGVGLVYVLSLAIRQRRLKHDMDVLEQLLEDE
ncbi:MAG: hypothetical protein JXB30_15900 [Anaerolineae bacterium]|nr:hypothetical protein [Anaerolineae bacterium]